MANTTANAREIRRLQRADGPAAMLAIGTANPPNCVSQDEYPEYYFRVTKSEHLAEKLTDTLKIICALTGNERRFIYNTEKMLSAHPEFLDRALPSLEQRLAIVAAAAPELLAAAATKAIAIWGRPATDITHLVVVTNSGAGAPSADVHLATLLGLHHNVRRTVLHLNGCFAGCSALRLAKDLAENNRGARVLVACVELMSVAGFRGPDLSEDSVNNLIRNTVFGDGAGAVIVGADPVEPVERPLFEMVSASQTVVPNTLQLLSTELKTYGLDGNVSTKLPKLVADSIKQCLLDSFGPLGIEVKWNDLFWAVHPGAIAILDKIDRILLLEPGKLMASRTVAREYGNMLSATIIFVLDEQRRRMEEEGEWAEWGAMVGFGPGFTMETMVLQATSNLKKK
ncbi:hypothetical protein CFC21_107271 [Triticum aestivum]|uniref:Chalcone synthase n=2 Tax=Triticum aestivum TaxID=4565 RepID=A0A9R1MFZ1_WHEAT|nr:bisdemethoxycurcumin synthase-like [Triticum aestivum]XP_044443849.1 bisdemethoxycurcumin synthase-like [Triticum aestivum]KAF7106550.1 hypothetical protein CFC21_107271 [Triticum aestivum]